MNKTKFRKMAFFTFFLISLFGFSRAKLSGKIGINYGRIADNLPPPRQSVELIKSMNAGGVKLYDAEPEILTLLAGTGLPISIMVPNSEISALASSRAKSDEWISEKVLPHYPRTMIRYLLVGNEVLSFFSDEDRENWRALVPAMNNLRISLETLGIGDVKIGTPLAMDVLRNTFPPSAGEFRPDVALSVVVPLLQFLSRTKSFFFIDVYPYFPWSQKPSQISLDFALLKPGSAIFVDPQTGLVYDNLLDQMLDSVIFAMSKLGFNEIPLSIAETGWPTSAGDEDGGTHGANVANAATYNRNLVDKISASPPVGTPARPGIDIPTFIFSLFDEDLKGGPGIERHWGLLRADGSAAYEVDLSGERKE